MVPSARETDHVFSRSAWERSVLNSANSITLLETGTYRSGEQQERGPRQSTLNSARPVGPHALTAERRRELVWGLLYATAVLSRNIARTLRVSEIASDVHSDSSQVLRNPAGEKWPKWPPAGVKGQETGEWPMEASEEGEMGERWGGGAIEGPRGLCFSAFKIKTACRGNSLCSLYRLLLEF
ncbi:hypothetical protein AAFF_G00114050 [Aldrovandia affinis]|uniref:Uncharacterized protein n=1 Tax=Aldrovandia affinis TaxID=143900 RepID=A0AAD7WBD2_9TELE|nr:hypothetical protein AAFF_G00114050 [Aldrovandia affinis]